MAIIISITLFLIYTVGASQNVCFLGKQLIFNTERTLTPTIISLNYHTRTQYWAEKYIISLNFKIIAIYKESISVFFNFLTTKYFSKHIKDCNLGTFIGDGTLNLEILEYRIYNKLSFGPHFLAPLKKYIRLQVDHLIYPKGALFDKSPKSDKEKLYGIQLAYGRDFVLWKYLKAELPIFDWNHLFGILQRRNLGIFIFRHPQFRKKQNIGILSFFGKNLDSNCRFLKIKLNK